MPSLRERVGAWIGRKAAQAMMFHPPYSAFFGGGLGLQPSAERLLTENIGVPDMAARAIGNRLASLTPQVKVSRTSKQGTLVDEVIDDNPLVTLLARPHPNFSKAQLLRLTGQWIVTVGAAHWLKVGNGLGVPTELHPIPPANIEPGWELGVINRYIIFDSNGKRSTLEPDTVIRIALPDPADPFSVEGYLSPMAISADSSRFAGEHLRSHYQHDATPPSILESDERAQKFNPEEKKHFLLDWQNRYHRRYGTEKGVPGILPLGYHLIQLAMKSGAEIVPLLDFLERQLLKGYGIPRSVLGEVVSGDRSSAETNQYVMDLHTIKPLADLIAEALTYQLAPDFDEKLWVDFAPFVSDDKHFTLEQEKADLSNKVRSINQVREDRGLDSVDWGELPVGQLGQLPYDPDEISADLKFEKDKPGALGDEDEDEIEDEEERAQRLRQEKEEAAEEGSMRADGFFAPRAEFARQMVREKKYTPSFAKAMLSILGQQKRSVLEKLKEQAPRRIAASRAIDPEELFNSADWRKVFRLRLAPLREKIYREAGEEAMQGLGVDQEFIFAEIQEEILKAQGALLIRRANRTTKRRIVETVSEGLEAGEGVDQLARRIRRVFSTRRAEARTIARTEVLKASQGAQLEAFKQSGVVERKRWNSLADDAVRDEHLEANNQIVEREEPFVLRQPNGKTELADAPGLGYQGAQLSAANSINCRCFVTPVILKE